MSVGSADAVAAEIRSLATPLTRPSDLDPLLRRIDDARFVLVGEASHGTHEFYEWRAALSRRLIEEQGFRWIGVEGDWPDCWRITQWVKGRTEQHLDAAALLDGFERWPTWLWANGETAAFLDWLRGWNLEREEALRVGFFGLDVYSLWDSLRRIMAWLVEHEPQSTAAAMTAWQCFLPYGEDPHRYAWGTRLVPLSCEEPIISLLLEVRFRTQDLLALDDTAFDAAQNAEIAAGAEQYYRTMVLGTHESWNIRDTHMASTIDRLAQHHGPDSRGIVWEHNTHVGDGRATTMASEGLVTVGQLVRERHHADGVVLVGMASDRGTVIAADAWGAPDELFEVPSGRLGSHEHLLRSALPGDSLLVFGDERSGAWLGSAAGQRAIGVVYEPRNERFNYVPTLIGGRYDALVWIESTTALHPLHHEAPPAEPEFETEPSGF